MTAKKTTTAPTEVDALLDEPTQLTLDDGFPISVNRLKTRGLLKLLKIFTTGAGDIFSTISLSDDEEAFAGQLVGLLLASMGDAEDEVIEFINFIVEPAELTHGSSKADRQHDAELYAELAELLVDPAPGDLITIIEAIVKNESGDIAGLGKRFSALSGTLNL